MMLDLRALKDFPARVTFEAEADDLDLQIYGVKYRSLIKVELDVFRSDNVYYCTGHVKLDVKFECSRCLKFYSDSLEGQVDFSIRESAETEPYDRGGIPENQLIIPKGTPRIDIGDSIREALVLEVPLKPLCKDDCRGLCPQCGVNRNEQNCQCKVEATDPRWDGLRELL